MAPEGVSEPSASEGPMGANGRGRPRLLGISGPGDTPCSPSGNYADSRCAPVPTLAPFRHVLRRVELAGEVWIEPAGGSTVTGHGTAPYRATGSCRRRIGSLLGLIELAHARQR